MHIESVTTVEHGKNGHGSGDLGGRWLESQMRCRPGGFFGRNGAEGRGRCRVWGEAAEGAVCASLGEVSVTPAPAPFFEAALCVVVVVAVDVDAPFPKFCTSGCHRSMCLPVALLVRTRTRTRTSLEILPRSILRSSCFIVFLTWDLTGRRRRLWDQISLGFLVGRVGL